MLASHNPKIPEKFLADNEKNKLTRVIEINKYKNLYTIPFVLIPNTNLNPLIKKKITNKYEATPNKTNKMFVKYAA